MKLLKNSLYSALVSAALIAGVATAGTYQFRVAAQGIRAPLVPLVAALQKVAETPFVSRVGSISPVTQVTTLTNSGNGPTALTFSELPSPYAYAPFEEGDCGDGVVLNANASCVLRMTVTPVTAGVATDILVISGTNAVAPFAVLLTNTAAPAPTSKDFVLSSNTANYDLFQAAGSPTVPVEVNLTINAGVYVYATSTSQAGLTIAGFPVGSSITVLNNGVILGKGGDGGGPGQAGSAGGVALRVNNPISLANHGYIAGGGGGGGGSSAQNNSYGGGGGGAGGGNGGSGSPNTADGGEGGLPGALGAGGTSINGSGVGRAGGAGDGGGAGGGGGGILYINGIFYGAGGGGGGRALPGVGGASGSGNQGYGGTDNNVGSSAPFAGLGGGGGGYGQAGGNGWTAVSQGGGMVGGAGGPGGAAVSGNSNITWTVTGTVWGSRL